MGYRFHHPEIIAITGHSLLTLRVLQQPREDGFCGGLSIAAIYTYREPRLFAGVPGTLKRL